jgi:hypothetical protein
MWTVMARISGARTTLVGPAAVAIAASARAEAAVSHGTTRRSIC